MITQLYVSVLREMPTIFFKFPVNHVSHFYTGGLVGVEHRERSDSHDNHIFVYLGCSHNDSPVVS